MRQCTWAHSDSSAAGIYFSTGRWRVPTPCMETPHPADIRLFHLDDLLLTPVIAPAILALSAFEAHGVPAWLIADRRLSQHAHLILGMNRQDDAAVGSRLE